VESQFLVDGLLRQSTIPGSPRLLSSAIHLVSDLRMTWELQLFNEERSIDVQIRDRARFRQKLELLPRTFPHLRQVTLLFTGEFYLRTIWPKLITDEMKAEFFDPLVNMSSRLPNIAKTWVALPDGAWLALTSRETRLELRTEEEIYMENTWGSQGSQLWYPFTDETEDRGRPGKGLWLKCGDQLGGNPGWDFFTGEIFCRNVCRFGT